MAKFIFTESQVEKIKKSLDEDYPGTDNNYKVGDCNINLYYGKVTYKGQEINDITAPQIGFTFDIDMDIKSYGIRGISLYNPKGPSEIELEIYSYPNEDVITIPLDWENVNEEKSDDISWIGYENRIEITLKNESVQAVIFGSSLHTSSR